MAGRDDQPKRSSLCPTGQPACRAGWGPCHLLLYGPFRSPRAGACQFVGYEGEESPPGRLGGAVNAVDEVWSGSGTLLPELGVAAAIQNRQHDDVALVWNRQVDDSVGEGRIRARLLGFIPASRSGEISSGSGSESQNHVQSDCSIASSTASASRPGSPSARKASIR